MLLFHGYHVYSSISNVVLLDKFYGLHNCDFVYFSDGTSYFQGLFICPEELVDKTVENVYCNKVGYVKVNYYYYLQSTSCDKRWVVFYCCSLGIF